MKNDELGRYERYAWVGKLSQNTNKTFDEIVSVFGSLENAWNESKNSLLRNAMFSKDVLTERFYNEKLRDEARFECEKALKTGMTLLSPEDENYPLLLKEYSRKPFLLYCFGETRKLNKSKNILGVVGSRNCTAYGREITRKLCQSLCSFDFTIVSGLARGIDTAAHKAVRSMNTFTVAVLGCGCDIVYPSENRGLYREIRDFGVVLSELPPGTPPLKQYFPARNRIIAGMSSAVLVCEAGLGSGALITAQLAIDDGRDVLAVPSNIDSSVGSGCNTLIKEGAYCITSHKDILRVYNIDDEEVGSEDIDVEALGIVEKTVFLQLCNEAGTCDSIADRTGLEISNIRRALTTLEINGYVNQRYDGVYYCGKFK